MTFNASSLEDALQLYGYTKTYHVLRPFPIPAFPKSQLFRPQSPFVELSITWYRNAMTSLPSGVITPQCRSPVSPYGVSTGVDQLSPSSALNVTMLSAVCVFSRIRQQNSSLFSCHYKSPCPHSPQQVVPNNFAFKNGTMRSKGIFFTNLPRKGACRFEKR